MLPICLRKSKHAMRGGASLFDKISEDDLILAFFPCIYFCATSQMAFSFGCHNYKRLTQREKTESILQRAKNREYFYSLLIKLTSVCIERKLRLIIENPWSMQTYLKANFVMPPTMIDNNRMLRGDYYVKPTAYLTPVRTHKQYKQRHVGEQPIRGSV